MGLIRSSMQISLAPRLRPWRLVYNRVCNQSSSRYYSVLFKHEIFASEIICVRERRAERVTVIGVYLNLITGQGMPVLTEVYTLRAEKKRREEKEERKKGRKRRI